MSKTEFRFKQFSVNHEKSGMKVGTDGVLLGAWASADNPERILDIGTGSGLIALMLAQRFPDAMITGIEIDKAAAEEAKDNFERSPFRDRLNVVHSSIQDFQTNEKFDLIVSNPPFFEWTHPTESSRNTARQQSELTFEELLFHSVRLFSKNAAACYIIPFENETDFSDRAKELNLFPQKLTRIRGNENTPIKRSLLKLSDKPVTPVTDELIIELARNVYTEDYISLTKEFYLKM